MSGNNQSANVATALDSALVVRVLDGAGKSVSGVSLTWTVIGGGSLSATTSTTDNNGLVVGDVDVVAGRRHAGRDGDERADRRGVRVVRRRERATIIGTVTSSP